MHKRRALVGVALMAALWGCGDDGDGGGSSTTNTTAPALTTTGPTADTDSEAAAILAITEQHGATGGRPFAEADETGEIGGLDACPFLGSDGEAAVAEALALSGILLVNAEVHGPSDVAQGSSFCAYEDATESGVVFNATVLVPAGDVDAAWRESWVFDDDEPQLREVGVGGGTMTLASAAETERGYALWLADDGGVGVGLFLDIGRVQDVERTAADVVAIVRGSLAGG